MVKKTFYRWAWLIMVVVILGEVKGAEAGLADTIKLLKAAQAPATITAQEMEYQSGTNILVAKGDVVIKQDEVWITAQKITINMDTGDVEAEGNVVWVDPEGRFEGDVVKFNQKTGLGYILHGKGYLGPDQYVQGDFIQRLSLKELRLKNGVFSGCESCEGYRDWEMRSKDMYVYIDDTAEAANLTLWIKEYLPVFYFPYIQTPATKRKSGFLIPRLGLSGGRGFYSLNAYFLAISDSQDLTIYLLNYSKQGIGGTLEYRYIWARGHEGNFLFHYFHQYIHPVENRWFIKGQHTSQFAPGTSLKVDVDYINNRDYEREFAEDLLDRSKRYAINKAFFTQNWDQVQALALAKYVEDLGRVEKDIPQRLPELRLSITPYKLGPLPAYWDFFGNIVHFHRIEGFEVERLIARPRIFGVLGVGPYLTVTPQAGIRETLYSRNRSGDWGGFNRFSYEGKVTAESRWAFGFGAAARQFRLVLEPRLIYQYIPEVDRSTFPRMDFQDPKLKSNRKNLLPLDFNDFELNHNRLLYSLGLRLYMRNPHQLSENFEVLSLSAANDFSFIGPTRERFGNVYFRTVLAYPRWLRWGVQALYNPNDQMVHRVNSDLHFLFNPYLETLFASAYSRDIDSLFFTGGLTIKPTPQIRIRFLVRYDANLNIFQERRVVISYEACCWAVSIGYVRDRNLSGRERDSIRFSLDLKNISGAMFK